MMGIGVRRATLTAIVAAGFAMPAPAQLFFRSPNFAGAPVTGDEPTVLIPLPGATDAEKEADIVWTMRAGLNFAALQCQFAPSLRTVDNYNQFLTHHSKELMKDYKTLQTYFKRSAAKGTSAAAIAVAFDRFNTHTYNSFSTVNAQIGFCQTASRIGNAALLTPKGELDVLSRNRLRELRNSLTPVGDLINTSPAWLSYNAEQVPGFAPDCFDKKGQLKKKCLK
jgi:hypothetical protein